ncbi:MAG: hypothetical protein ABIN66_02300 [candidate division WOR-3 bacterium]
MWNTCLISMVLYEALWAKTFGTSENDYLYGIAATPDGGIVVTGEVNDNDDIFVAKLSPLGAIQWAKTIGGQYGQTGIDIIPTSDGGYAVLAGVIGWASNWGDIGLVKLNANGDIQWAKAYGVFGQNLNESPVKFVQTPDGGFVIVGSTNSFGCTYGGLLVFKVSSDGSLVWSKVFYSGGQYGGDMPHDLINTSDGGLVIAGYSSGIYSQGDDFLIIKLSADGSVVWMRLYEAVDSDQATSILQTPEGYLLVAGSSNSFGIGEYSGPILLLSPDGNLLWAKLYRVGGTNTALVFRDAVRTSNGDFILLGHANGFGGAGSYDIVVIKISSSGALLRAQWFGGSSSDYSWFIGTTADGEYVLSGYTRSFGAGGRDILLLRVNREGDYPGCLVSWNPREGTPSFSMVCPSYGRDVSPSVVSVNPPVSTISLTSLDLCAPVEIDESEDKEGGDIICHVSSGRALFYSSAEALLEIYSPDGTRVLSYHLREGRNEIILKRGLYLWRSGTKTGKVVVR